MEEPSDLWGLLVVDISSMKSNGCCCHSLAAWSTSVGRNDPVPIKRALNMSLPGCSLTLKDGIPFPGTDKPKHGPGSVSQ